MTASAPRRATAPSDELLKRVADIGWMDSVDAMLAARASLPEQDPSTPLCRELMLAYILLARGDFEGAVRVLLQAIRRAPRSGAFAQQLRYCLSNALIRLGRLERAERLLRKMMSSLGDWSGGGVRRRVVFNDLGRLARRKGQLTVARLLYEQSLEGIPEGDKRWYVGVGNLIHADLRAGSLERVLENLAKFDQHAEGVATHLVTSIREASWLSYLIEIRSVEGCERRLASLRANNCRYPGTRNHLLLRNYEADILLLQGRNEEAAATYSAALEDALAMGAEADLAPSLARGLAESLFALGDFERADDRASWAIRAGALGDRLEELIGYRIQGQCRWAMGRHDDARSAFRRALTAHLGLEFAPERKRLQAVLIGLGLQELSGQAIPVSLTRESSRRTEPTRLQLKDGKEFLTFDHELERQIRRAANSDLPVLIEGETGTGKELVAMLVHELAPRSTGPFVVADCSTLPETLVEAELFGAVRGAFTGCTETRAGIVASAEGGTLFLDELPELSLAAQAKLLRLLQEGTYRRVGESTIRRVRTRFIAATNRPISELLTERRLKPDLFHRLNGHRIHIRPLRERQAEIAPLARGIAHRMGLDGVSPDAIRLLERAPWNGNVRELEMMLRVLGSELGPGASLTAEHVRSMLPAVSEATPAGSLREQRLSAERARLTELLELHRGNVSAASRVLGISRQAFYKALRRTGAGGVVSTNG